MLAISATAVLFCLAAFALRQGQDRPGLQSLLGMLLTLIVLVVFLHYRNAQGLLDDREAVAIAVVYDVSLSMAAEPDPRTMPAAGTRRQRANRVVLPLLARIDASAKPALVAVTAFAAQADTVLSWDDDLPQITEVVEHVLTSGLLSEPGSSLAAALHGALRQFENLPGLTDDQEQRRFLLIVSDGEQTEPDDQLDSSLNALLEQGVSIIALYTGMDGVPEGLIVRDADGEFVGFDEVGGQLLTMPDAGALRRLAGAAGSEGFFVDARDDNAMARIAEAVGITASTDMATSDRRLPLLLLMLICVLILKRLAG